MKNGERLLNRRSFLKKACVRSLEFFFMGVLAYFSPRAQALAGEAARKAIDPLKGLSLRKWCLEKRHHRNGYYLNPFSPFEHRNFWRLLRWKLASKNHFKSYYHQEKVTPVDINWAAVEAHGGCAVTYLTHACVMIKDLDRYLLVDPVLSGLFGFKNFTPLTDRAARIPSPDHVLITHGHYDHLDVKTLKQLNPKTHVISPLGYRNIFRDLGMKHHAQLDWFESFADDGREVLFLPCNHWTMRNPLAGPNDALWGSFLIKGRTANIFISGDLAWFDHFAEIGEAGPIDLAIFNLGAYEPRWFMKNSHINPAETVRAFKDLKARHLMIIHWGTFRLGDEPVHFPPRDIRLEMERQGLADGLIHLNHGQTLLYARDRFDII